MMTQLHVLRKLFVHDSSDCMLTLDRKGALKTIQSCFIEKTKQRKKDETKLKATET